MIVRAILTCCGIIGGATWLGIQAACLAAADDAPLATACVPATNDNSNPYSVIMERNAFRLNPPPPPPEPPKPPPPALPEVKLSGFMQTGNQWKVLLAVKVKAPDPKAASLNSYLALSEGAKERVTSGENQFVVEMVKIYADQQKAEIINSGTPETLSMKDDGFGSPVTASGGGMNPAVATRQVPKGKTEMTPAMREHPPLTEEDVLRAQENGGVFK